MKRIDTGIFLHRIPYSETSLITAFYTREHGLKRYLFKGGKKKSHQLFPMAVCELNSYGREDSKLRSLTTVEPSFPIHFQFDPIKSTIAFFMAEILMKCLEEELPDEFMFQSVESMVKQLNTTDDCQLFPLSFLVNLSNAIGIQPLIDSIDSKYFNLDEGVIENYDKISQRVESGKAVDLIINVIQEKDPEERSTKQVREQALEIMLDYFRIHVPRFEEVTSYEIVKEVLHS